MTVEYTHKWVVDEDFHSSSLDALYYNANNNTAVLDWDGHNYRYAGVSLDEVLNVVKAQSVGGAAARLKTAHGPGYDLGWYTSTKRVKEEPRVVIHNNTFVGGQVSLKTPAPVAKAKGSTHEVHFTLFGQDRVNVVTDADDVAGAVAATSSSLEALDLLKDVKFTKVVTLLV